MVPPPAPSPPGSDCGLAPNTERFLTWSDRWGANRGLGKRVLLLDLAACPQLWRKEGEGAQAGGNGAACEWQRLWLGRERCRPGRRHHTILNSSQIVLEYKVMMHII